MASPNSFEWPAKPRSHFENSYNNRKKNSHWINETLNLISKVIAHHFVQCFNLELFNLGSRSLHDKYQELESIEDAIEVEDTTRKSIHHHEWSRFKAKIHKDMRNKYLQDLDLQPKQAELPKLNLTSTRIYRIVDIIFVLRFFIILVHFNYFSDRRYAISVAKSFYKQNAIACTNPKFSLNQSHGLLSDQAYDTDPKLYAIPVSLSTSNDFEIASNVQGVPGDGLGLQRLHYLSDNDTKCHLKIKEYFDTQIEELCFWSKMVYYFGGQDSNSKYLNFNVFEYQEIVQIFTPELNAVKLLVMSTIFIFSSYQCILNRFFPQDISILHFIYKPGFAAFRIHCSTNNYLYMLRTSYLNFWADFKLSKSGYLLANENNSVKTGDAGTISSNSLELSPSPLQLAASSPAIEQTQFFANNYRRSSWIYEEGDYYDETRLAGREYKSHNNSTKQNYNRRLSITSTSASASRKSQQHEKANNTAPSDIVDSINFNFKQFDGFLPEARTQGWRVVLMFFHPILWVGCVIGISSLIFVVTLTYRADVISTYEHNKQLFDILSANKDQPPEFLNDFLFGKTAPPEPEFPYPILALHSRDNHSNLSDTNSCIKFEQFQDGLLDYIVEQLSTSYVKVVDHNQPVSKLKKTTSHNILDLLVNQTKTTTQPANLADVILDSISPNSELEESQAWFIMIITVYMSTYIGGIMVIFSLLLLDILFWLFEICIKLNVCICLLRHYSDRHMKIRSANKKLKRIRAIRAEDAREQGRAQLSSLLNGLGGRSPQNRRLSVVESEESFESPEYDQTRLYISHDMQQLMMNNGETDNDADRVAGLVSALNNNSKMQYSSNEPGEESSKANNNGIVGSLLEPDYDYYCDDGLCNIKALDVLAYVMAGQKERNKICDDYANRILKLDFLGMISARQKTNKFLISTYLQFRLFQDEIDLSRPSVSRYGTIILLHSLYIFLCMMTLKDSQIKYIAILASVVWNNILIIVLSSFKSSCHMIPGLIYSMLASGSGGDKFTHFILLMWRKSLNDLTGAHTTFAYKLFNFNVEPATVLEIDLTMASIVLLTMEK